MTQAPIRHILLDIEGTTCPVAFVSDVLFPYARQHLARFLTEHGNDASIAALLKEVEEAWELDADPSAQALRESLASTQQQPIRHPSRSSIKASSSSASSAHAIDRIVIYLKWLIQQDRKLPALKELQGLIWEDGYENGMLRGPLFADVAPALQHWQAAGLTLSVYSSGSRKAQQLLYQYSNAGDLRHLFEHWFDTTIGSKLEPASYEKICRQLASSPAEVLFISDSLAELNAANRAGLVVLHSDRSPNPNPNQDTGGFNSVRAFSHLDPISGLPYP
ncbi:MAG: acireductone synthase [Cyanobium sp.]